MGAVALRRRATRRPNRGVRRLGEWRIRARHGASPPRRLRSGLLRVAGSRLPTASRDARRASTRVPRRRLAGAVLPRQRHPVGGRVARRGCGGRHAVRAALALRQRRATRAGGRPTLPRLRPAARDPLERRPGLRERKHRVDLRAKLACVRASPSCAATTCCRWSSAPPVDSARLDWSNLSRRSPSQSESRLRRLLHHRGRTVRPCLRGRLLQRRHVERADPTPP